MNLALKADLKLRYRAKFEFGATTNVAKGQSMKDSRLLVPVEDAYIEAIGRATYVFATLEWNVVWCCEHLKPGYINKIKRKTAGEIAANFLSIVDKITDHQAKVDCKKLAVQFKELVKYRNGIMHGKPGSSSSGEQLLYRDGSPWTCDLINKAADEFAFCSEETNKILNEKLANI